MTGAMALLGISGSLRRQSFSTALLNQLPALLPDDMQMTTFSPGSLPLYNQDEDATFGAPGHESVRQLRAAIETCDAIIIVSPEYNWGMPGVLKNLIDWASRPAYQSPLKGKPVLIVTTSPGLLGGVKAHPEIRHALISTLARPVLRPDIAISGIKAKLESGTLTDPATIGFLKSGFDDLRDEVQRMRRAA